MFKIRCPSCAGLLSAPEAYAGRTVKCPKCKGPIVVPVLAGAVSLARPSMVASSPRGPTANPALEKCGNCGRSIGKLEEAFAWQAQAVCAECRGTLGRCSHPKAATPFETANSSPRLPWIVGCASAGCMVLLGVVYLLFVRDRWESQNHDEIVALKSTADRLVMSGQFADAKSAYADLFHLVGDHALHDDLLKSQLSEARLATGKVEIQLARDAARATAEEQRRQEAIRVQQEESARLASEKAEVAKEQRRRQQDEARLLHQQQQEEMAQQAERQRLDAQQAASDSQILRSRAELAGQDLQAAFNDCRQGLLLQPLNQAATSLLAEICGAVSVSCLYKKVATISAGAEFLAVSPTGKIIVSTGPDGLKAWDVTGRLLYKHAGSEGSGFEPTFSPSGKLLVLSDGVQQFKILDSLTGKEIKHFARTYLQREVIVPHTSMIRFSPSSRFFLSAGLPNPYPHNSEGTLDVFDIDTGRIAATYLGHTSQIDCLTSSPDGTLIASAEYGAIKIWNKAIGKCIRTIRHDDADPDSGLYDVVGSLAFTSDGQQLISFENVIRVRSLNTFKIISVTPEIGWRGLEMALLPDDQRAIVISQRGPDNPKSAQLWNFRTGKLLQTLDSSKNGSSSLGISGDGAVIAIGGNDGHVGIWTPMVDAQWKREAVGILYAFREIRSASFARATNADITELAWAKSADTGDTEAAETARIATEQQAEIERRAAMAAENQRQRDDREANGSTPQGEGNRLCKRLVANGQLISADFVEYSWNLGKNRAAHLPSDGSSMGLINVIYDFTFMTQGGGQRTHRGYVVVEFHHNRFGNPIDGKWAAFKINIDGRDLNPEGVTITP